MNGYEKRTKLKKNSIISAAWKLFSERGITDVGINEIATLAKVSQVSIYNYFGNKNNLAKEVL
ncbi:MAG: TetR/AcrR family transcriptional regulator, partial [Bacteroidales bacterium]